MRALILTAGFEPTGPREPSDGQWMDRHLQALVSTGFREVVVGASASSKPWANCLGDGARWGVRLHYCEYLGPGGDTIDRALPLLDQGPFALLSVRARPDYPLGRLRAVKCDWAHLVLLPARVANEGPMGEERFQLRGARVVDGAAGPDAPAFAHIAVCHPRLFVDAGRPFSERLRQAARDHLVTAEVWNRRRDGIPAPG